MEQVMAVPLERLTLQGFTDECGLITKDREFITDILLSDYIFMERGAAEEDTQHKQIIPYVMIRHENRYLMMRRLRGQTENRLHDKLSLGVGGHINPDENGSGENIIIRGMYRELNEEISLHYSKKPEFLCLINDPSTTVGKVHLGMAFLLETDDGWFSVNEKDKMTAEWVTEEEIIPLLDQMETWSSLIFQFLTHCR